MVGSGVLVWSGRLVWSGEFVRSAEARGGVGVCGMGSTVTAKRICSIAFDNCCFGCGLRDMLLSVLNLASSAVAPFVSSGFIAILPYTLTKVYNEGSAPCDEGKFLYRYKTGARTQAA